MSSITSPITRPAPPASAATALVAGGALWITAAAIGGDDETARFYTAEAFWFTASFCLLVGTYALWRLRPHGQRPAGTLGFGLALAGRAVFVAAEAAALTQGTTQEDLLPAAVLLTAVGMLVAGIAVLRERAWNGWARFAPLVVGVFPFLFMVPFAAATGAPPTVSLVAWGLTFVALGTAARPPATTTTRPVSAPN